MPTRPTSAAPFRESLGTACCQCALRSRNENTICKQPRWGGSGYPAQRAALGALCIGECFDALCAQDVQVYPLAAK